MAKAETGKHYRHYRNREEYIVIAIGHHTEMLEELVIYEGQYEDPKFGAHPVWARPRALFEAHVEYDGKTVDRFQLIE